MTAFTPKPVKVFTREDPCTKVDLFNCFNQGGRYVARAVVEARGEIGINAIKYLLREDLAILKQEKSVDYWQLTKDGEAWLDKGLARHLELHPEDAPRVNRGKTKAARITRTRG